MKKYFIILWFDMHATYYCNFLKFLWLCWLHNTQKYIIKPYVSISKTSKTNHCIGQTYYHIMAHTVPKLICHKLTFEQYLPILVLVKLKTHLSRNILHLDHIHVICFSLKAKLKLIPSILRNILIFLSFPYIFVGNFL